VLFSANAAVNKYFILRKTIFSSSYPKYRTLEKLNIIVDHINEDNIIEDKIIENHINTVHIIEDQS
jgi:hypothetical protein